MVLILFLVPPPQPAAVKVETVVNLAEPMDQLAVLAEGLEAAMHPAAAVQALRGKGIVAEM